jgi:integrase/recombinase XerD
MNINNSLIEKPTEQLEQTSLTRDIFSDEDFIKLFLMNKIEGSVHTFRGYTYEIKAFLSYISSDDVPLRNVTAKMCIDYRETLKSHNYAAATIQRKLNIISSLYKFGMDTGYFKFNPMKAVKKPKVLITSQQRFLTPEEVSLLLNEVKGNKKNYLMCILFITIGLRVSELSEIKWCDFFQDTKGNIGLRVVGKGTKQRTVKVRRDVWSYIIEYRIINSKPIHFDSNDNEYLFTTKNGKITTPRSIRETIKRASIRAGIRKDISPHFLRHTSASLSISGGADIQKCMEQYGWSQMKTAQRYIHSVNELEDTAADYIKLNI